MEYNMQTDVRKGLPVSHVRGKRKVRARTSLSESPLGEPVAKLRPKQPQV